MSARRGAGEGHIKRIRLKSGRQVWRAWLTVGYRANGTPIRRTAQRATRQLAVEALARLRERYAPGANLDLAAEGSMRLHQLLDRWIVFRREKAKAKARSVRTYEWAADKLKAATPHNPLIARLTPLHLQDVLNQLPETLAPKSLNLCRVALKGAFAKAMDWRLRTDNPAAKLALPERERDEPERRIITPAEADRLFAALADERFGLAVALTYAVAARPGEAAALRRQDIDLEAGTLTISAGHNRTRAGIKRERPKSGRGVRVLTIPAGIRPWIAQQLARAANERAAMGAEWSAPDEGLLFVRESDGGPISADQLYDTSRRVSEAIGLGVVTPRILRRSVLSLLGRQGVSPKVRAAIGGHTAEVTDQYYREVAQDEIDAAMAQVLISTPIRGQHSEQRDGAGDAD